MADQLATTTVPGRLAHRASERPDEVAHSVLGVGDLTFREWDDRSNAIARGLVQRGVTKGSRVVLPCAPREWLDYAIAYVATQKARATAVPVPQQFGHEHIAGVVRASNAVGIVGPIDGISSSAWCAGVRELENGQPHAPIVIDSDAADDAEILFTSGTTGVPKGVVANHENLLYTHSKSRRDVGVRHVLHALPPGTLATQGLLLQPLDPTTHRVITLPGYDNRAFLAAAELCRATDVVLVPALAMSLIRYAGSQNFDLSAVETVRTMSAPIAPSTLAMLDRLFENAVIINMYTTTEAWPARMRVRYSADRPGSVGQIDRSGSVRIVDRLGQPLTNGSTGNVELSLVGAPRRRYLDDSGVSRRVFLPNGWVRTGDTGFLDSDGYLYLVDRNADLVITGGLNVSTIEVEAAILEFPSIIDVAAFGLPHPTLGEYLAAAVQVAEDFSPEDFGRFLQQRLGSAKAPKRTEVLDELPRNPMGKVLKKELRHRFASRPGNDSVDRPASPLELRLKDLWSDAVGEEPADRTVSFMALGGTSLGALEIVARVRSEIGHEITQRDIYDATGLTDFASRVAAAPVIAAHQPQVRAAALAARKASRVQELPAKYSQGLHYDANFSGWSNMNVPVAAPLSAGYDRRALELALNDLVQRHEALRTTLARTAGNVVQQVHETSALQLEVVNSTVDVERVEPGTEIVHAAAYEPFFVRGGWLVRCRICRIAADLDVLVLSTHHAVCDGWSAGLLYRDLVELYSARLEQREPRLPGLTMQLADYASWERSIIQKGPADYWRECLRGGNPLLALDGLRDQPHTPGRCQVTSLPALPPTVTQRLDNLGAVYGTTRARILAAAVITSLRGYLQETLTIGFVTANRGDPALLNVVGDLADVLPVRVDVSGSPRFSELVTRLDRALTEAYEYQTPYGVLEGLLRAGSDRAAVSALDVSINYLPTPRRASETPRDSRHLFQNDRPWELRGPILEIDQWWKMGALLTYTFVETSDGGLDTGIFADLAAITADQVTGLSHRLDLAIGEVTAARLDQLPRLPEVIGQEGALGNE